MKPSKQTTHLWYKARLTPMADGLFTDAFYPPAKRGSGNREVYFTQISITPSQHKVIVASRFEESGVRMLTHDLAQRCLIPHAKATRAEMTQLNSLTTKLKV